MRALVALVLCGFVCLATAGVVARSYGHGPGDTPRPAESVLPDPNGWDLYVEAAGDVARARVDVGQVTDFLRAAQSGDEARLVALQPAVEAYLAAAAPALQSAHRAAGMPAVAPQPMGAAALVGYRTEENSHLRMLSRLLCAEAILAARAGRSEEALGALEDSFALGVHCGRGGAVADSTASSWILVTTGIFAERFWASEPDLPAPRIAAHAREMHRLRTETWSPAQVLDCEARRTADLLSLRRRDWEAARPVLGDSLSTLYADGVPDAAPRAVRTWCAERFAVAIRSASGPLESVDLSGICQGPLPDAAAARWARQSGIDPLRSVHALPQWLETYRAGIGRLGESETAALLAAYHAEHGTYPADLRELAVALDHDPAPDPWTGTAMAYQPLDGGYVLRATRTHGAAGEAA
jgi:hypothetical protein